MSSIADSIIFLQNGDCKLHLETAKIGSYLACCIQVGRPSWPPCQPPNKWMIRAADIRWMPFYSSLEGYSDTLSFRLPLILMAQNGFHTFDHWLAIKQCLRCGQWSHTQLARDTTEKCLQCAGDHEKRRYPGGVGSVNCGRKRHRTWQRTEYRKSDIMDAFALL